VNYEGQAKTIMANDKDKNGYLDKDEVSGLPGLATQFETWDLNGDGMVYPEEIKQSYEAMQAPQWQRITVAAMSDGINLFHMLDANSDQQLSLREMKAAASVLEKLDTDLDLAVSLAETPAKIRLAIARGNETYKYLSRGQDIKKFNPPSDTLGQGPAWFIRMDTNGDGDVTRREFLGDEEQFKRLDTDGDGAISYEEVSRL
jgi:hypothetical protein